MLNYRTYYNDLISLSEQAMIFNPKKDLLYHYTDILSDSYFKKLKELIAKYKNNINSNNDYKYELQNQITFLKKFLSMKLYLYLPISSHHNEISIFEYYNSNVYKPTNYKKQREDDFHIYIKTLIMRLNEGLKLKISIPYIICMKILEQIKDLKKYKYFYDYIKNIYLPKSTKKIGLCHQPNGIEVYKLLIFNNIEIKKTPEAIHKLGLSLLPKIIPKTDFHTFKTKELLFKECQKIALYVYDNIIDKYFHYKPDRPFVVKKVPANLEESSSLAYYDPIEDIVFINLKFYNEIDNKSIYQLFMHECFHQYHYRFMKFHNLPIYKKYGYDNIGLIEGFAHYMEDYLDAKFNDTYYKNLRIIRLVVDTGINYYGWSYKKAFSLMNKYFPNRTNDIISEIDRYICNPSQSFCYVIGKLEIIKMRDKFLKSKKGSIKDFHHNLLINGTCSFQTIQEKLNKII
jgi:uncharacterized protein (DUF885 family)